MVTTINPHEVIYETPYPWTHNHSPGSVIAGRIDTADVLGYKGKSGALLYHCARLFPPCEYNAGCSERVYDVSERSFTSLTFSSRCLEDLHME
jgi:hypothetical protein